MIQRTKLTAPQAARLAKVSRATIWNWLENGWLQGIKQYTPGARGRPSETLFEREEIIKVARERGRIIK